MKTPDITCHKWGNWNHPHCPPHWGVYEWPGNGRCYFYLAYPSALGQGVGE